VTYDGPVTIHVNGEDVHLIPIRNAHTDGDTLISFPGHDIRAVGDYFRSAAIPYVDLTTAARSQDCSLRSANTIGAAGPTTKIIPGTVPSPTGRP